MIKRLAALAMAFAAVPAAAKDLPAPDRQVEGLNPGVFAALKDLQTRSIVMSNPEGARSIISAVMQDKTIDPVELDLLAELTQDQFLMIAVSQVGAADRAKLYLYPAREEARTLLFLALDPELETVWAKPHHGWTELQAKANSGPGYRTLVQGFLQAKLGEQWAASNMANRYQPLRGLIGDLYTGSALAPGVDTTAARAMLHQAMKNIDASADDRIPDYLYNWVVAPPATAPAS